uniref:Uncharacterized protein n=1 Tax=viral metagenome TaxID=1070528 RepID=A0A6C0KIY9_9ZZZZ
MILVATLSMLFVLYYGYSFFVFNKLRENSCNCEKLNTFKKSFSFRFLFCMSILFLIYNLSDFFRIMVKQMNGGSKVDSLYTTTLMVISAGYALSFFYDFILIRFFNYMKEQKCPCQVNHRKYLKNITYVKSTINIFIYLSIITKLDKKIFKTALKKHNKKLV